MGYLYAIPRYATIAEDVYQNAAILLMEKQMKPENFVTFELGKWSWDSAIRYQAEPPYGNIGSKIRR